MIAPLVLAALAASQDAPPTGVERLFVTPPFVQELVLEPDGRARFAFRSGPGFSVGVFVRSDEIDPRFELWVEGRSKHVLDDEGGKTTPYLRVAEEDEPAQWLLDVTAKDGLSGVVTVHLVRHPESAETVAIDELGRSATDAATREMRENRQDAALAILNDAADSLLALEGSEDSWRVLWRAERVGLALADYGDPQGGYRCMERALRGRRRVLPPEHVHIDITERNAVRFLARFAPAEAIERAEGMIEHRTAEYPPGHDRVLKARDLLASCLERAGQFQEAIRERERIVAARPRDSLEDRRRLSSDYRALNRLLLHLEDGPGLLASCERAVGELEELLPPDDPALFSILEDSAGALRRAGRRFESLELYDRTLDGMLEVFDENDSKLLACRANRASVLKQLGRIEEATAELEDVLRRYVDELGGQDWMQPVLWVRGTLEGCYAQRGRTPEALELIELQLAGYHMRPDLYSETHPSLLHARAQRAIRLINLGRLAEAREEIEDALAIAERAPANQLQETRDYLLGLSGSISASLGDLVRARATYERYLASGPPAGDVEVAWVEMQSNYVQVLLRLGENERAWGESEVLRAYMERVGPLPTRHLANNLAERSRAWVHFALGRHDEALASIESVEATWPGADLQLRAWIHGRLGDSETAIRVLEEGDRSHAHVANPKWRIDAGAFRPLHYRVLGQHDRAGASMREHAEDLVRLTLDLERTSSERDIGRLVGESGLVLANAIAFALEAPDDPEIGRSAFAVTETLRGAPLVPSRLRRIGERDPTFQGLLEELQALSRRIADVAAAVERASAEQRDELGAELDALARERDRQRGAISARLVERDAGRRFTERASVERVARALGEREAAVSFHRFRRPDLEAVDFAGMQRKEARYAAAVVRADASLAWLDLGTAAEVEGLVASWRSALGVGADRGLGVGVGVDTTSEERQAELAARLHACVLEPVLASAGEVDRLVISPSATLGLVPWDALPEASGAPLGDRVEVALVESLRHIEPEPPPDGDATLLVMGGVAYDEEAATVQSGEARTLPVLPHSAGSTSLIALPGTAAEAETIADAFEATFPEGAATRLTGAGAGREQLLREASGARFVHLATHGWFAAELAEELVTRGAGETLDLGTRVIGYAPLTLCGLALAGANRGDGTGRVTAEELAGLDLSRCELATLSACESAVGLDTRGEGLASMRRALSMAGARYSLTSLWSVPDNATRDLMIAFYEGLWTDKLAPRAALWRAKRTLREAGGTPRDWAGWVLFGPLRD